MNLASNVRLIRPDVYSAARRVIYTAGGDWPKMLGAAETLSQSPDWTDTQLARQVRKAYSLHLQNITEAAAKREAEQAQVSEATRGKRLGAAMAGYLAAMAVVVILAGLGLVTP
jgi:hypothetical protein